MTRSGTLSGTPARQPPPAGSRAGGMQPAPQLAPPALAPRDISLARIGGGAPPPAPCCCQRSSLCSTT